MACSDAAGDDDARCGNTLPGVWRICDDVTMRIRTLSTIIKPLPFGKPLYPALTCADLQRSAKIIHTSLIVVHRPMKVMAYIRLVQGVGEKGWQIVWGAVAGSDVPDGIR